MILRKYMSLLGIGSARIDLILPKETYKAGEHINGYFIITGGTVDQKATRIECELVMTEQLTGHVKVIGATTILTPKVIRSERVYQETFTFDIPATVQASTKEVFYSFKTKLIFIEGVADNDYDRIRIM